MFHSNIIKFLSRSVNVSTKCKHFHNRATWFSATESGICEKPTQTINDVRSILRRIMGVQQGYQPVQKSRAYLLDLLPKSQDELPPRSMKDSFDSAVIPLSSDFSLQDKYVNFMGSVRFGRFMEDLDLFAVHLVFKHLLNPKQKDGDLSPAVIVTILVDEITVSNIIPKHNEDIRISGHVSWVGTSSAEVTVWLEQCIHSKWEQLTHAIFLMAVRNSTNTKSTFINKLIPADEEEKRKLAEAERRTTKRKKDVSMSLLKTPPTVEEQDVIHGMFLNSVDLHDVTLNRRILPPNAVWMKDTKLSNIIFSHPEERNLHNKIFGGFLMRSALELAFMTAFSYCKQRPRVRYSSGITFHHPVDVGAFLRMTGQVVYTEKNYMQIIIYAEVLDPFSSKVTTSNVFHYTYESSNYVQAVVPDTYSEAMMYIDGRRNFHNALKLN